MKQEAFVTKRKITVFSHQSCQQWISFFFFNHLIFTDFVSFVSGGELWSNFHLNTTLHKLTNSQLGNAGEQYNNLSILLLTYSYKIFQIHRSKMPVYLCKQIAFKTVPFSKWCIFGNPSYIHPGETGSVRSSQYIILIKCFVTTCSAHSILDIYAVTRARCGLGLH